MIRPRRLATVDPAEGIELWLLESEGFVVDPVNPESPARRVVTQYAHLFNESVGRHAAATLSYSTIEFDDWGQVRGNDHSGTSCAESGTEGLAGLVHRGTAQITPQWDSVGMPLGGSPPSWGTGRVVGVPVAARALADHDAVYDSVGVRWDILTDPNFPVEYDGVRPDFGSLPSDEYPLVRVNGDLYAGSSWSGRGVLIVTGEVDFGSGFYWDGIVMAGEVEDTDRIFWIRGMLIGGLNGGGGTLEIDGYPLIYYDVCSALDASEALAYFEPVGETWWEVR